MNKDLISQILMEIPKEDIMSELIVRLIKENKELKNEIDIIKRQ